MKPYFLLLAFITLVFILPSSYGQTTVSPATNTLSISLDTTYTLTPGGGANYSFLVCSGVHLTVTGLSTYLCKFYMEPNSIVTLDDTFNFYVIAKVYIKQNAIFDFNRKLGSYCDTIVQETGAILQDTATSVTHLIPTSSLTFNYSNMPGGVSPCSSVLGLNTLLEQNNQPFANPVSEKISLPKANKNVIPLVFNVLGEKGEVLSNPTLEGVQLDVSHLKPGIYFLRYQLAKEQWQTTRFVKE